MASKELSLVGRYDDTLRHPLFDCQELDLVKFITEEIKVLQQHRGQIHNSEKLQEELKRVNKERKKLEVTLAQARQELEDEMMERKNLQVEYDQLARQMQLIKELVGAKGNQSYNLLSEEDRNKLAFLNYSNPYGLGDSPSMLDTGLIDDSLSLLSDSEYDKTGEDLLLINSRTKRRSKRKSRQSRDASLSVPRHALSDSQLQQCPRVPTAPPESGEGTQEEKTPPKRRRLLGGDTETSVDTDDSLRPPPNTDVKLRKSSRSKRNRSLSAGASIDDDDVDTDSFHGLDTGRRIPIDPATAPRSILKKGLHGSPTSYTPESPTIKRWASASKLHRPHNLINKNVVIMRPETCAPCGKKIRFGSRAYKCKDCKVVSHVECKDRLSQLCIPVNSTPSKGTHGTHITDFAPTDPPYVAAIILRCVNEVESRGFNEEGIYRKSGSEREVKELKERFMKGKDPKLESIQDIHVVCGCMKDFLRNLKEPLIPTSLWTSFVNAAHMRDEQSRSQAVRGVIKQLAPVNRDCIAFIIIHLQRVSESPGTRMNVDNLARVFGPTMVGYSVPTPEPMQMIEETQSQQNVMTALLEHSTDYWTEILCGNQSDVSSLDCNALDTPDVGRWRPGSDSDASVPKSAAKVKKFFGESPRMEPNSNKTYFPSPMLK